MPPKVGIAIGTMMSDPRPVDVSTGKSARIVVAVVIRAGRMRRCPASIVAARTSSIVRGRRRARLAQVGGDDDTVVGRDAEQRQEADPDGNAQVERVHLKEIAH